MMMIANDNSGSIAGRSNGGMASTSVANTKPAVDKSVLSSSTSSSSAQLPENLNDLVYLRIHVAEFNLQKCLHFPKDTTVWEVKQKLLATLPSNLEEAFNYGLFSPPFNGKAGKFLDDERTLAQYPLPNGPVGYLELKYKRRVYKINVDEKTLRTLHSKSSRRKFLDYVQSANVEKVCKFCDRGLDPNFHADSSLLSSSAATGCSGGGENETPLTLAAQLRQPNPVMNALVHGGAHLDFRARADGGTALHRAAQRNNFSALTALLELGASPDYRDAKGLTALYYAVVLASDAHLCERLLHEHASIGVANDSHGWQEVHQACRLGRVKHLEHLIFYGGDDVLNARNVNGNTPLHIAAASNQESCVRYLLFRGADKLALNCAKQNCQQVSILAGNYELAEIIAKHSADDIVKHCERPSFNPRRRGGRRLINGKPAPPAPPSTSQQNSDQNGLYANHCDLASNLSASKKSEEPVITRDLQRSVSDINGWVASTAKRSSRRREQLQKQQHQRTLSSCLNNDDDDEHKKPRGTTAASSGVVADGSHSSPTRSVSLADDDDDSCNEGGCDDELLSTPSTASRNHHRQQQRHRALVHTNSAPAVARNKNNNTAVYGNGSLSSFESSGSHPCAADNKLQISNNSGAKALNETTKKAGKVGQTSPHSGVGGEDTSGVVTDKSSCNSDSPQPHPVISNNNNNVVPFSAAAPPPINNNSAVQQTAKNYGHTPKNSISSSSSSSGIAVKQQHEPDHDEDYANEISSRYNSSARPSIGSTHTIVPAAASTTTYGTPNSGDTLRPAAAAAAQHIVAQSSCDADVLQHARTVQVRRGSHGFGFVLRGSRSGIGLLQQTTTTADAAGAAIDPPALQYLDEVDDGGPGDLAGLRPGDFLIAINDEDVRAYPHERCVNMIRQCKDLVELTVVTMMMTTVPSAIPSAFAARPNPAVTSRLGSQRSATGSVLPASMNRTVSASAALTSKQNMAKKTAPAPPRRSPHTSLSTTGGDQHSTTDLDDSISTSDSAFLPSVADSSSAAAHQQFHRYPSERHQQQQNHYETSDRVLQLHPSISMPNTTLSRTNHNELLVVNGVASKAPRHSSSSSSTTMMNNKQQFSSVSQMKRTREKQRRRAAAEIDGGHHQRQSSSGSGVPRFYTEADDDDEIDYYYQHVNNTIDNDAGENYKSQHRSHHSSAVNASRAAGASSSIQAPLASRSKSESRTSHQKRRSKKNAVDDDDSVVYYQPQVHYPSDYGPNDSYQQQHYYHHHQVGTMPHSHTFHNELADYGQQPRSRFNHNNSAAELLSSSYQPQPVAPLTLRQNYNSRTLGHSSNSHHQQQQQQQQHHATLSHQHSTPHQHAGAPTMRRTPYSQPDFASSSSSKNGGRKQHYQPKLDPITSSPMPPTLLSISATAESHENEPMPDYYEDDDDDEIDEEHRHRHHQSHHHGNRRENVPPYYSPASSSARSSQQPSNVSDLSYPTERSEATTAAAVGPKSILRSRLPQAPAPPPLPPPGSLQDATSTVGAANSDDAATTLSVGSSSLMQDPRGSNSAFASAISQAAATLRKKRAENAAGSRREAANTGSDTFLMAGIANITRPMALIPTAAAAAKHAEAGLQVAVKEFDVFQADLKRALERRRTKMQSDSGESCAK